MAEAVWVGIDLGTQSVRAVAVDATGTLLAAAARPLTSRRDGADALGAEIDADPHRIHHLRFSLSSTPAPAVCTARARARTVRRRLWPPDAALATMSAMDVSSAALGLPVSDVPDAVNYVDFHDPDGNALSLYSEIT